jgi:hypothetical protein
VCKTPVTAALVGWHLIAEMADRPNLLELDHNDSLSHRFDLSCDLVTHLLRPVEGAGGLVRLLCPVLRISLLPPGGAGGPCCGGRNNESPLGIITEARWIHDYFDRLRGRDAGLTPNGIDKAISQRLMT